jgi:mannose-1-phosphate guanylyltransferase
MAPSALVALLPSDHYFGNESRFINYVDSAFEAANYSDETVVLLGAEATSPGRRQGSWPSRHAGLGMGDVAESRWERKPESGE